MLYYLAEIINAKYSPPGFDIFRYLTFRSALSAITALLVTFIIGPLVMKLLKKHQIGEAKKIDGPKFHWSKAGTPTMGGVVFIFATIVATLLTAKLNNFYIVGGLLTLAIFSLIGIQDDYKKISKAKNIKNSWGKPP